jgi:hypothetical protein
MGMQFAAAASVLLSLLWLLLLLRPWDSAAFLVSSGVAGLNATSGQLERLLRRRMSLLVRKIDPSSCPACPSRC